MVYSVSGSVDLISAVVKDRNVLAIRNLKNFSKLKIAYILAKDEDEIRAHGSRTVPLKDRPHFPHWRHGRNWNKRARQTVPHHGSRRCAPCAGRRRLSRRSRPIQ